MKEILSVMVVGILVLSGLGAVGLSNEKESFENNFVSEYKTVEFSKITINELEKEYIELGFDQSNTYLMEPGKPILPKIVKIFELPFGAKNVMVEVESGVISEESISGQIKPSPRMQPLISTHQTVVFSQEKDLETYNSDEPYPSDWYSFSVRSGLNKENKRVTKAILHLYPVKYIPLEGKILTVDSAEIKVKYEEPDPLPATCKDYDLVIITPNWFKKPVQELVNHKNDYNVKTLLKTTESIYKEFEGVDKPEKIKYFIKYAIEKHNITYVLLIGGLKSQIYAKPRDHHNYGARGWYVPVRYSNLYDNPKFPLDEDVLHDPGVICDLYYADVYDGEGKFSDWDPSGDKIFANWNMPGYEKDDTDIDMVPDVCLGRLPCRSRREVKTVVDKIINYEKNTYGKKWFNKMTVVSGDGFLDQEDLNIKWDTSGLSKGYYTLRAQSINDEGLEGPVDIINFKIDRSKETVLTFNHDDHLNPALDDGYPAPPIAEIVSISPGNILGWSDYEYTPSEGEAYGNDFMPWANLSFVDDVLTIRGKSYDPQPYGNVTNIHVWIKNDKGEIVFSDWRNNTEMYYEGEWTTGEKVLKGRGGALYYMDGFEKDILWASNGRFTGRQDVKNAINKGAGFLFMSGHGSPNVWADHYPGVPGNRGGSSITGLSVTRITPFLFDTKRPFYPIDTLNNGNKLPVAVIGGCHNSQFNVSMVMAWYDLYGILFDFLPKANMWCYGTPVPECFSWRLVRNPNGGSIASIGNTGLGYGMPGKDLTTGGGDGWITIEFFKQYGAEGHEILGEAYAQTLTSYIDTFDMSDLESGHAKSVQQWVLFGDPTLKIGGRENPC